jgi:hypothetical protein
MKKVLVGIFLVVISIVLGCLFFIKGYHDVYWSTPAAFIIITLTGVLAALCGSFLLGNSLASGESKELPRGFLLGLGGIIALAGGLLGLMAIFMAISISTTGYWGQGSYSYDYYSGDYLIMGFQIMAFQVAIIPEIIGSFLLGLVLQRKGGKRETTVVP